MATLSKTAVHPIKKNPVQEMEREASALRIKIDAERSRRDNLQNELATLLATARGAAKFREPLAQGALAAQRLAEEARQAVTRHLGKETESVYVEKLFEAEQASKKAQEALADFDKQYDASERSAKLRAAIQQVEQELKQLEDRQVVLTAELDQAVAHQRAVALSRLLTAYQDLYTILETDGEALARMRLSDPQEYGQLMSELAIDQDTLFALIDGDWMGDGSGSRPILQERQATIRARLAKLK